MVARPMMRSVSLTPGNEEQQRDARIGDQVAQAVDAVVAAAVRHDDGLVVDDAHEAVGSPRGEQSSPSGPMVASAKNGDASISLR